MDFIRRNYVETTQSISSVPHLSVGRGKQTDLFQSALRMTYKNDLIHFENCDRDSSNLTANSGLSREAVETVPLSFDVTEQAGVFNEFEVLPKTYLIFKDHAV